MLVLLASSIACNDTDIYAFQVINKICYTLIFNVMYSSYETTYDLAFNSLSTSFCTLSVFSHLTALFSGQSPPLNIDVYSVSDSFLLTSVLLVLAVI